MSEFDYAFSNMILKTEQLEYLYSYQLYKIEKNPHKKENLQESNQDSFLNNKKIKLEKKEDSYFQDNSSKLTVEANKLQANKVKEDNENLQSDVVSSNISNMIREINGSDVSQIVNNNNNVIDENSLLQRKGSNNNVNYETYCKICNKMQNSKIKLQKCYSGACNNVFCQDCFSRNHYQTRAASCSCNYFACDFCGKKKICIMSTILCGGCDKRVCSGCYYQQHIEHGNVKIFGK